MRPQSINIACALVEIGSKNMMSDTIRCFEDDSVPVEKLCVRPNSDVFEPSQGDSII